MTLSDSYVPLQFYKFPRGSNDTLFEWPRLKMKQGHSVIYGIRRAMITSAASDGDMSVVSILISAFSGAS